MSKSKKRFEFIIIFILLNNLYFFVNQQIYRKNLYLNQLFLIGCDPKIVRKI